MSAIKIRGIYATALTELLSEKFEVVDASEPIRGRFNESFPTAPEDAVLLSTDDDQGLEIVGDPETVAALRRHLANVGRDTLVWSARSPVGAVFEGEVTETLGSGAIVDLGTVEGDPVAGFLPYDRVDDYVETGDRYRVQVASAASPWADTRPTLATEFRVSGGLLELRRGGKTSGGETARLADLLPNDPPVGWKPRWAPAADDADLDQLAAALELASERVEELTDALETDDSEGEDPRRIAVPRAGAWVWFGRESRFELDSVRRRIEMTMSGHHRIKAATPSASAAVDFAEAICAPDGNGSFPFGAVTRQFGPTTGDSVVIAHGKPDGRLIELGRGEVIDRDLEDTSITVERELSGGGTYDALGIERVEGDVATTTFVEGQWWYPTVYRSADGDRRGTYVNVCTPLEIFPDAVRYVDLHVDVVKGPDGTVDRVDDDELNAAVDTGNVSEELAARAREVAASIERVL